MTAAFMFLLLALAAQQEDEALGSVSGRVLCAETAVPLSGVSVQLVSRTQKPPGSRSILSGADGSFAFEHLQPGEYSLTALKPGHPPAEPLPIRFSLDTKQTRSGIEIRLHRPGVITGKVEDAEGQPIAGAEVTAHRIVWLEGERVVLRAKRTSADDRGEFRLFGLSAGRYLIGAAGAAQERPPGELDAGMMRSFYPSGAHASEAMPVDVYWGRELGPIDIVLRPHRSFNLIGRVIDADTSKPCGACKVRIANLDLCSGLPAAEARVASDGSYRVHGLSAGAYRVSAEKPSLGDRLIAARVVQIVDASLRDVNLAVGTAQTVSGRLLPQNPPAGINLGDTQVRFRLAGTFDYADQTRVRRDLSFEAAGLSVGTYRVDLEGVPSSGYLKSLRVAGHSLPGREIEVREDGSIGHLEFFIAFDSAAISGTVKLPDSNRSLSAYSLVLFPDENQSPFIVERRGSVEANGTFKLTGIAPGLYVAYALPEFAADDWQDPEYRRRFAGVGTKVDLGPGKMETIELAPAPPSVPQ